MNEQSLDAITNPRPNRRQSHARALAALCMVNYPNLRRANLNYLWAEIALRITKDPDFASWVIRARIHGLKRFAGLVFDIWQYWLDQ